MRFIANNSKNIDFFVDNLVRKSGEGLIISSDWHLQRHNQFLYIEKGFSINNIFVNNKDNCTVKIGYIDDVSLIELNNSELNAYIDFNVSDFLLKNNSKLKLESNFRNKFSSTFELSSENSNFELQAINGFNISVSLYNHTYHLSTNLNYINSVFFTSLLHLEVNHSSNIYWTQLKENSTPQLRQDFIDCNINYIHNITQIENFILQEEEHTNSHSNLTGELCQYL